MKGPTDTTNTDDQTSDGVMDNKEPGPSEGPEAEAKQNAEKKGFETGDRPWPVERGNGSGGFIRDMYELLSYSYMNRIFEKGMKQFKSGEHLDLEDLFEVPKDMSAAYLVDKFW